MQRPVLSCEARVFEYLYKIKWPLLVDKFARKQNAECIARYSPRSPDVFTARPQTVRLRSEAFVVDAIRRGAQLFRAHTIIRIKAPVSFSDVEECFHSSKKLSQQDLLQ